MKIAIAGLVIGVMLGISITAQAATISIIDNPTVIGSIQCDSIIPCPQGSYQAYDHTNNLAYGVTPDVSGTLSGFPSIHNASNLTDGNYGNGRSWIGIPANNWLRVDLGSNFILDNISFGRDRLGSWDDRDPGQFTIEASLNKDNGYTTIVNSSALGFSGLINGNDTILTSFTPNEARFIRMTFANFGAAIDEVEVHGSKVPEPSTLLLLGSGFVGIAALRRKQAA